MSRRRTTLHLAAVAAGVTVLAGYGPSMGEDQPKPVAGSAPSAGTEPTPTQPLPDQNSGTSAGDQTSGSTSDAPEASTCAGQEATEWTQTQLSAGESVRLVADPGIPDRGRYDRLLRYVHYDGGLDYGTQVLQAGHADAMTYNSPPHHLANEYAAAEVNDGDPASCYTPEPTPERQPQPDPDTNGGGRAGIPPPPPDLDCSDVNGPIQVAPGDPHRFDGDGDGVGCE